MHCTPTPKSFFNYPFFCGLNRRQKHDCTVHITHTHTHNHKSQHISIQNCVSCSKHPQKGQVHKQLILTQLRKAEPSTNTVWSNRCKSCKTNHAVHFTTNTHTSTSWTVTWHLTSGFKTTLPHTTVHFLPSATEERNKSSNRPVTCSVSTWKQH